MTSPIIEPARAGADFDTVHELLCAAFAAMDGRIDPPSSLHRQTSADLAQKADAHHCLLAWTGAVLTGCVFIEERGDTAYLGKLAVHPSMQRKGIGRALLKAAEDLARTTGKSEMVLETRIELIENHQTFAAMGFAKTGETAHPGFDRPTSITMSKPL